MVIQLNSFKIEELVHGFDIVIHDEEKLAEYVSIMVLGGHRHILRILESLASQAPKRPGRMYDRAIDKLTNAPVAHRDGWIFQMISWIALKTANSNKNIYLQIPHDSPAQHGIDGLGVILDKNCCLEKLIITEDKATENARSTIRDSVWPEFLEFEEGKHDDKLVNRVSGLIPDSFTNEIQNEIEKDVYRTEIRRYRVGITAGESHKGVDGKKRLFKGYDECVSGVDLDRRSADTLELVEMRSWMDSFCLKVIAKLKDLKANV